MNNENQQSAEASLDPTMQWYALRATYGREMKAKQELAELNIQSYVPLIYQIREVPSKCNPGKIVKRKRRVPVANLVFIYASPEQAYELLSSHKIPYLYFRYNHLEGKERGQENPITVSDREMRRFMNIADIDSPDIIMADTTDIRPKGTDRLVMVTRGDFQGVVGKLVRIKGEQRIMTSIGNCRWNIATGYVPTAYIEEVDEDDV